ncbi:MAG: DNA repair protein RecO [Oscillospiraceae bacterium]|nr:DNA repair protein RecO [Oscillospiraceae bacterium]
MYVNTMGLVLRETAYKDSSKILTVMTAGHGKLTISAHGALRKNSKIAAVTQLLAFSEMTLYQRKGRWTLTEARSVEQFIGLRTDIGLLSLGAYFAELMEAVADEDAPSEELLPLILNALFALSAQIKAPDYVKPAFELRLMVAAGFAPLMSDCVICGQQQPPTCYLDYSEGTISCAGCGAGKGALLSEGALRAMRYVAHCDAKKLFAFTLGQKTLREFKVAAEGYLLAHLDRSFRTLDYYKSIII